MKSSVLIFLGVIFFFHFGSVKGQKNPRFPQCPVYSITPEEIYVGYGAGQVYPTISVSTLNNCTNYNINNSYGWMSYTQNGLEVTIYVTANNGYTQRSGCLNIGAECASVTQDCHLVPFRAGSISGQDTVCQGETEVEYSVDEILYATGYVWSLPDGATITSGGNTNHITVSFSTSASSGNVKVYGTNDCNMGSSGRISPNFPVTVIDLPVAPVGAMSSETKVCENGGGTIILTSIGGSGTTLRWLKGNCVNGEDLGTGDNIEVPAPTTYNTTYYARWETSCHNSTCASVEVDIIPIPVITSITQQPDPGEIGLNIVLTPHLYHGGGYYPTYSWTGPNNWTSEESDPVVNIGQYDPTGPYYLDYTSSDGCVAEQAGYWLNINYGKSSSTLENLDSENKLKLNFEDLTIYPNPTSGEVNISQNQLYDLEVTIYNSLGKLLFKGFNLNKIDLSRYVSGTYLMTLKSNGKAITHIINLKK